MTLSATRNDETTIVAAATTFFGGKKKSPDQLVDDAIASFTAAEKKLENALNEIAAQEAALVEERLQLDAKIEQAQGAKGRLARIQKRITDLLA